MTAIETPWPERLLLLADVGADDVRDAFDDAENAAAAELRLEKRRAEWLASRYAVKRLAVERRICSKMRECRFERPFLFVNGKRTDWVVSVSHSGRYVAAAIAREPVGVDIEVVRSVSPRAAHFFLTDDEIESMRGGAIEEALLHFWCAKEAAWKQRSGELTTLRQVPLTLIETRRDGLLFDVVETLRIGELIVALTR